MTDQFSTFRPMPKKIPQKTPRSSEADSRRDPASFIEDQIVAIHGPRPRCFFTLGWQWVDGHHILGRGHVFGVLPEHQERAIFSSPYNFAPLARDIHHGPARDEPEIRVYLLRIAAEKVDAAIRDGRYTRTELDTTFLTIADTWRQGVLFG